MFILSNNLCVFLPKACIHVTVKLSNTRDLFFLFLGAAVQTSLHYSCIIACVTL